MTKQLEIQYKTTDEYEALIEDCKAIVTERIFNARTEIILAHGQLGERIVNDPIYKKHGKGNQELIKQIARDMGVSWQEVYRSIQFYEKFKIVSPGAKQWDKFAEGKNISWKKIKTNYLPEGKSKPHDCQWETIERCKICKKVKPNK